MLQAGTRQLLLTLICVLSVSDFVSSGLAVEPNAQQSYLQQCKVADSKQVAPSILLQKQTSSIIVNATAIDRVLPNSSTSTMIDMPSSFVITVPIKLARFFVICLPLGIAYLGVLWKRSGLLEKMGGGFRLSERETKASAALCTYLVMLVSMDLVIKTEAERGNGTYATSPLVMVPLAELGKLLVSLFIYLVSSMYSTGACRNSSSDAALATRSEVADSAEGTGGGGGVLQVAMLMLPVALIYNLNNLLVFAVLATIQLDAYAVWRNISILFNALLWVWTFRQRLEFHRWIAIVLCLAACCLNSLQLDGRIVFGLPVAGVVLSACLSSIASVFNEYVIKARASTTMDIDQINMILYVETLSLMLIALSCWVAVDSSVTVSDIVGRFGNLTAGGLRIVTMQVALGLSVSRVLKFADSVAKTVVGSLRDVVVVFVAPFFVVGTRFDWVTIGSVGWMACAGMIYFTAVGSHTKS